MLFQKTVDGIVADISKKVEDLHGVADRQVKQANSYSDELVLLSARQELAVREGARARRLADKFKALIE